MKMHDDSVLIIFKERKDFDINKDNFIFIAHADKNTVLRIIRNIHIKNTEKVIRVYTPDCNILFKIDEYFNRYETNIDWEITNVPANITFSWDRSLDFSSFDPKYWRVD